MSDKRDIDDAQLDAWEGWARQVNGRRVDSERILALIAEVRRLRGEATARCNCRACKPPDRGPCRWCGHEGVYCILGHKCSHGEQCGAEYDAQAGKCTRLMCDECEAARDFEFRDRRAEMGEP